VHKVILYFFCILHALAPALSEPQTSKEDFPVPHPQEEQSGGLSVVTEGEEGDNEKQLMTRKLLEVEDIVPMSSCPYFHEDCF